jgi:hypothetical protein
MGGYVYRIFRHAAEGYHIIIIREGQNIQKSTTVSFEEAWF